MTTERRIRSITFVHDGTEWTATVGEPMRGVHRRQVRGKGGAIETSEPRSDPATVIEIRAGTPYIVTTNEGRPSRVGSAWENPFMAGRPRKVEYFDGEEVELEY